MKARLAFLISFIYSAVSFGSLMPDRSKLEQYSFVLLLPQEAGLGGYQCAMFSLESLKVCRFPNGPMWNNVLKGQTLVPISSDKYKSLLKQGKKLDVLCIDKVDRVKKLPTVACGFALPWENGMAYVFNDIDRVDKVRGVIVEKTVLVSLGLLSFRSDCLQEELDEIDSLIGADDFDDEFMSKPLPYPLQQIKIYLGKAFIACLMKYHEFKSKLVKLMKKKS